MVFGHTASQDTSITVYHSDDSGSIRIAELATSIRSAEEPVFLRRIHQRGQFYTLILGKHPYMVIALNSYAVSDSDLVYRLKTQSCAYGYICARHKQLLSNMVAALIIYETGSL